MKKINRYIKISTILLSLLVLSAVGNAQSFEDKTLDAASPAPVKLISFDATKSKSDVIVTWKTSDEVNNSHFIIERSTNGIDFTNVGQVAGNGNSTVLIQYKFTDINTPNVKLFYMLQQVDFNGRFEYSPVVLVNAGKDLQSLFTVFPNPIENRNATISTNNIDKGKYYISVKSLDGKNILNKVETIISNNQLVQLQLPLTISAGIYIVQIENNSGAIRVIQKIIVQ